MDLHNWPTPLRKANIGVKKMGDLLKRFAVMFSSGFFFAIIVIFLVGVIL